MDPDLPPPILVEDARGLSALLADLDRQTEIAVDTEADSFFSYREKVCLVQVSVEDRDYLVDPLADIDLAPLGRTLADPAKLKVFHDGEYDILILKRDHGFEFRNLFDTRVAAAALGIANPGLASVLRDQFAIELDKSMQRSNWGARPLTDRQIRYARLDTRFLLPLMRRQREALAARAREELVAGECRRLERLVPPDTAFDPDDWVLVRGARHLGPVERALFRELFVERDRLARDSDQSPFRVVNNETLLRLVAARPRSGRELARVQGLSPRQARRYGDVLLGAIQRGLAAAPIQRPPEPRPREGEGDLDEQEAELHERLKELRKRAAARLGTDAALVLNRHLLPRIVRALPEDRRALAAIDGVEAWQVRELGDEVVALVRTYRDEVRTGRLQVRRPWRKKRG